MAGSHLTSPEVESWPRLDQPEGLHQPEGIGSEHAASLPWYRRPAGVALSVLAVAIIVVVAVVAFRSLTGGSKGGPSRGSKVVTAPEAPSAANYAADLIGDNPRPLGAIVPAQFPQNFPLPGDAKVVAAFAAASSDSTVSVTFTTSATEQSVWHGWPAAGYQPSSDMEIGVAAGGGDADAACSASSITYGLFRGSTFVGVVHFTTPGAKSTCKATITVAVGPDVRRSGG